MASVTAFQAKTRFGELLNRVARGEEVFITRHDRPVARLVPEGGRDLARARQAVAALRAGRAAMARCRGHKALTAAEVRAGTEEGRR